MLSRSALMRRKKAEGMSVGDIARLFGVSYHAAYNAVVVRAGARDYVNDPSPSAALNEAAGIGVLPTLTWNQILTVTAGPATKRSEKIKRATYRAEADRRDPTGEEYEKQLRRWEKQGRPTE